LTPAPAPGGPESLPATSTSRRARSPSCRSITATFTTSQQMLHEYACTRTSSLACSGQPPESTAWTTVSS
jgi:hypothetical protein